MIHRIYEVAALPDPINIPDLDQAIHNCIDCACKATPLSATHVTLYPITLTPINGGPNSSSRTDICTKPSGGMMLLSELKVGMIVYVRGVDPNVFPNPPFNMYYECLVLSWTAESAKLELHCNGKTLGRKFSELIDRLPENLELVDIGVWRDSSLSS